MTDVRYTEKLIKKGEERKRLTKQLAQLVADIADQIAESVPEGTYVKVGDREYCCSTICSNLDCWTTLRVCQQPTEENNWTAGWSVLNATPPGAEYYLHGDFNVSIQNANRSEYLWFANHLSEVLSAFEVEEDKIIEALREGFEKLKKMAANA